MGNPKKTPYIMWVFTGYNPQEFLGKAINTMPNCHLKRGGLETWQKIVVVRRCCGELLGGYGRNKGGVFFVFACSTLNKGKHMIQNLRIIYFKRTFLKMDDDYP